MISGVMSKESVVKVELEERSCMSRLGNLLEELKEITRSGLPDTAVSTISRVAF